MGIFNIFKRKTKNLNSTTDNGILGPTFLENKVEHIINPVKLYSHEWRRKLKIESGGEIFKIKYYGKLHPKYNNLIIQTDLEPSKIYAIDISTNQEILLFDGCKHGYNALLFDKYTEERLKNRVPNTIYSSKDGNEEFELIISTYNGIDYEDEFKEDVDSNGKIELVNKNKIDFEDLKRNGFDTLQIWGIDKNGNKIEIVSEELA